MKTIKKLFLTVIAGIFIILILVFAAGVVAIKQIDPETAINQSIAAVSRAVKGTAAVGGFELTFFPRPRLILYDATISIPGQAKISGGKVTLYPGIIPLFRRKIQISRLICDAMDASLNVDRFTSDMGPLVSGLPLKQIMGHVENHTASLTRNHPGIRVGVHHGKIQFIRRDKPVAWISDVNARLRLAPETARFDITCRSSLWQQAGVSLDMDYRTVKAHTRIDLKGLKLDNIPEDIFLFQSYRLARVSADFHATLTANGSDEFIGKINGSAPDVEICNRTQNPVVLRCSRFKGEVYVSKNRISAKLDQLVLNAPQAVLAGRFHWDKTPKPMADLEITGSVMDVATARTTALQLIGQFRTTQKIFEIVRAGVVPRISFTAAGHAPGDLGKTENIGLQGRLIHGKIVIPKQDLHLDEASGEVVLAKGILSGKNIRARMGNSYGRQGNFSIGMIGLNAPYHLETLIEADLAQLPPVLVRLIHHPTFNAEMMRLSQVSGRASGKLVLGDRKDRIKPRVEVAGFTLSMNYNRIPLTFRLAGEKVLYENRRMDIENITGTVGKNTFSGVDAVFDWQDAPTLFCRSKPLSLIAEEITPWLKSFAALSPVFNRMDSAKGLISLTEAQIQGPLFEPAKWQCTALGNIANLAMETPLLPGPIAIVRGQLRLAAGRLDITDALIRNPDGELAGSVTLTGNPNRLSEINARFSGKTGGRTLQSALDRTKLPLRLHEDKTWTLSEAEINHSPGKKTAFKALATVSNGPSLALDLYYETGALSVNKLFVKDDDSDASFSLHRHEHIYDVDFAGHFYSSTLKNIFAESPVFPGALAGDFTLHVETAPPGNARLDGQAEISDFMLQQAVDLPIKIEKAALTPNSGGHKASGSFLWDGDTPFSIDGKIQSAQQKITFDVTLFSEKLDVDSLIRHIRQSRGKKANAGSSRFWEPSIYGNIDIHAGHVNYAGHTWSPVNARAALFPDQIRIEVSEALSCGFETPGSILIRQKTIDLDFHPRSLNQAIEKTLPCFGGKNGLIQGNMDVVGNISAKGSYDSLMQSVNGKFTVTAKSGRIFRLGLLAKIFSILNITEIYRGTLPDLTEEGFKYSAITANGEIKGSKIIIPQAMIDGASMDIALNGEIDYRKKTMDINLLVAPLKTIDFIVKNTPLVNDVLTGAVVSIPLKARGNISNPEVTVLEPPSIGGGLLQIIENTLKLPVKIIKPVFKSKKENQNGIENHSH